MAILPILLLPDARLRETCAPVTLFDAALKQRADDMLETMYAAPGRGLAGPQVGAMQRIFVMDVGWKEGRPSPMVCINPVIKDA
ncbi:peptide deformylase, partial [Pseudorhodobacter sp.]|uniref:peptide deformylase n=1 Tax=Pseudorhodobacter sp. TaxID=1934400 RepID=UPI002648B9AC